MAGLEPARAFYGPTDFKSVFLPGKKSSVAVLLPLLAPVRIQMNRMGELSRQIHLKQAFG